MHRKREFESVQEGSTRKQRGRSDKPAHFKNNNASEESIRVRPREGSTRKRRGRSDKPAQDRESIIKRRRERYAQRT